VEQFARKNQEEKIMAAKSFDIGSNVMVKTRDGKNIKGTIFNYVKYIISGNVALYQVKLNNGSVVEVWPEEVTG
jgi:flagellar hook assembly protein FlgD